MLLLYSVVSVLAFFFSGVFWCEVLQCESMIFFFALSCVFSPVCGDISDTR